MADDDILVLISQVELAHLLEVDSRFPNRPIVVESADGQRVALRRMTPAEAEEQHVRSAEKYGVTPDAFSRAHARNLA